MPDEPKYLVQLLQLYLKVVRIVAHNSTTHKHHKLSWEEQVETGQIPVLLQLHWRHCVWQTRVTGSPQADNYRQLLLKMHFFQLSVMDIAKAPLYFTCASVHCNNNLAKSRTWHYFYCYFLLLSKGVIVSSRIAVLTLASMLHW